MMSMDELFVTTVVTSWRQIINRLDERLASLDDEQLQKQVAPNKNRLFYLLGHLTAVHDHMLPLLGIGERLHPELDEAYLTNPDQTTSDPLAAADLLNRNDGRRPENKPRTWQSNDILFNLSPISKIQRN
jgi:hypothetical protein